jgi:hypothetical protein
MEGDPAVLPQARSRGSLVLDRRDWRGENQAIFVGDKDLAIYSGQRSYQGSSRVTRRRDRRKSAQTGQAPQPSRHVPDRVRFLTRDGTGANEHQ